jgi:transmembrane sensor
MNDKKRYRAVEDLLTDDSFLAWYHRTDDRVIKAWEARIAASPEYQQLANEAVYFLELLLSVSEMKFTEDQITTAKDRLFRAISEEEKRHLP